MTKLRRKIYVTEPGMIDMSLARKILEGEGYELVEGSIDFEPEPVTDCDTLLIRSETHVTADILSKFPNLKHVIRVGVGLDNVDTEFCKSHNIKVHNAPGANSDAVAEYVTTMVLSVLRHTTALSPTDALSWNRMKFMGRSVSSQAVGIVGFGHIGRLLQQKMKGLGCQEFIVFDPYLPQDIKLDETVRQVETLEELLTNSTVVSLHVPLLPSTKHLINAKNIPLLPKNAILVNAARGGVVDELALLKRMDDSHLTYIADTVENEPEANPDLVAHERVIVTPHIASLTAEANENMLRVALKNYCTAIQN